MNEPTRSHLRQVLSAYEGDSLPFARLEAPPAGSPSSIGDTAAGGAASAIADVWQRGDKFAHGALPAAIDDVAAVSPIGDGGGQVVPVRAHQRGRVGPLSEKKPVTLDAIVCEYRKSLRLTTQRHLFLGRLIAEWLSHQPEREEQLPRAAAILIVQDRIEKEGLAACCRPHRDLKCFHAARLLGGDAASLSIGSIYQVLKLVERAGEKWQLVAEYEAATRSLWARMLAEKLAADLVRREVAKILPPRALKLRKRKVRLALILRSLEAMSCEARLAVRLRIEQLERAADRPAA